MEITWVSCTQKEEGNLKGKFYITSLKGRPLGKLEATPLRSTMDNMTKGGMEEGS